ncbi:diaminopimelate epimerase [Candidatus Tachikawaea gelatinosa]|uniref:Diaminopimelate epimerase n=1 Tax=Candidatus Tachikawaea gelatinosa TaxID=1410383 RepID=A0A090AIX8_9ENTR|nr:diaminopimelate epimerase [Candidatus Tachikawaea gelatinosa]BAP58383.1 diaminopimelate epimerase [Candidatus Tachikawaea gelatinosa]
MKFSKMHGLGNDFVIIDGINQKVNLSSKIISKLSNRNFGIGFDQLLLVESSRNNSCDFNYRVFNSNGNEVEQCGNGARCFARFVYLKGLTLKKNICVKTKNRIINLTLLNDNDVSVNMGEPIFDPKKIPFLCNKKKKRYKIHVNNNIITCGVLSMGNPHCILQEKNVSKSKIKILGPLLENNALFPEKINVSFMEVINNKHIKIRVYERDIGETQACGSGACACVAYGYLNGFLSQKVKVDLLGGSLDIFWEGLGKPLFMIGSATHVYDGDINI